MDLSLRDDKVPRDTLEPTRFARTCQTRANTQGCFVQHMTSSPSPLSLATNRDDHAELEDRSSDRDRLNIAAADSPQQQPSQTDTDAGQSSGGIESRDEEPRSAASDSNPESDRDAREQRTAPADPEDSSSDVEPSGAVASKDASPMGPGTTEDETAEKSLDAAASADPATDENEAMKLKESGPSTNPQMTADQSQHVAGNSPAALNPGAAEGKAGQGSSPTNATGTDGESPAEKAGTEDVVAENATKRSGRQPHRSEQAQDNTGGRSPSAHTDRAALGSGSTAVVENFHGPVDEPADPQLRVATTSNEPTGDSPQSPALSQGNSRTATPAERLSEHLLARTAARSENSNELTQVDQSRLIQRVARAIHAAPQRGGLIRLRLRPPELGSLHVEVHLQKGVMSARLEAETQMARAALLDNLPQLRQRLSEQGVRIEHFEVDVSPRDTGGFQHPAHEHYDRPERHVPHRAGAENAETSDQVDGSRVLSRITHQGNLNVLI